MSQPIIKVRLQGVLSALLCATFGVAQAATLVVNSADDADDGTCNTTHCSLREAITAANATTTADTINFAITLPVRGEILIRPNTVLPTISQPLTINGQSQNGTSDNTDPTFSNANLRIRLDGGAAGAPAVGLAVCANNTTIRGLILTGFVGNRTAVRFGKTNVGATCPSAITGAAFHGNYVGMNNTTSATLGNSSGLSLDNTLANVGSTALADRNVFGKNNIGIQVINASVNTFIVGNLFGMSETGAVDLGNTTAVSISASNVRVGTTAAPNRFRFNNVAIRLSGSGVDNQLYANAIQDSNQIPITFDGGITVPPNDSDDADSGPNGLANYPEISAVSRISGGLHIEGRIDAPVSVTPQLYRLGLYASFGCHISGNGEGELFLGIQDVAIRGNSNETFAFNVTPSITIPVGYVLTMTVDGPDGTSPFSECVNIDSVSGFAVNSTNDLTDAAGCDNTHCSLREAIADANDRPGPDGVRFAIPVVGTSEQLITLTTPLPEITETLTIDGYSQAGTSVNTDPDVSNAVPRIRIHGQALTPEYLLRVCADDVVIRGLAFSGANPVGGPTLSFLTTCPIGDKDRLKVIGNFFGLQTDGVTAVASQGGVNLTGADAVIGGTDPKDRNVFAAGGVRIDDLALNMQILGNLFGTDKSGTLDRGQDTAIQFDGGVNGGPLNLQIGSETAPNLFRFNGIGIRARSDFNPGPAFFPYNRFLNQDGLAVDFGNSVGVSPNDSNDVDSGANTGQNFPVISEAFETPTGVRVVGNLDVTSTTVNVPYQISIYANTSCDSSGNGEGDRLLAVLTQDFTQTTGESFEFVIDTKDPVSVGQFITALATGPDGTSEFSACRVVADPIEQFTVNTTTDTSDGICNGTHCSLREAITLANNTAGPQQIIFSIPGDGPHAIALTSLLPIITENLTIDAYTEPGASPNSAALGSNAVIKVAIDGGSQANILRTCTDERIEVRGLSLLGAEGPAIATNQDTINCAGQQSLVLRGNWFGIAPDGSANGNVNALSALSQKVEIGSGNLADRNLFGNSAGFAVRIAEFGANSSAINNNLFGVGPDGVSDHGNSGTALELSSVDLLDVGGPGFEANEFRFNERGIVVKQGTAPGSQANSLFGNEFSGQTGMSIDLSANGSDADGVTPNDVDDLDSGPNSLQNAPVLTTAIPDPANGTITVSGNLDVGNPVTQARNLAFYLSRSCNNTLRNEAELLAVVQGQNFSTSQESFSVSVPDSLGSNPVFVSATVTGSEGTSEFSNCIQAVLPDTMFANSFE